jgi:hypothetical protein
VLGCGTRFPVGYVVGSTHEVRLASCAVLVHTPVTALWGDLYVCHSIPLLHAQARSRAVSVEVSMKAKEAEVKAAKKGGS